MLRITSILVALAVSGCVIHTTGRSTLAYEVEASAYAEPVYIKVNQPPPPLRADQRPGPKPHPSAVWVPGHWRWSGGRGWVWVQGRWMRPRPGYVWEPPVVVAVEDGSYQYHPGYWRRADVEPPPVYRTPGTILVHARPAGARVVVERVPPRRARQTTVVVRPAAPSAPSSTVVVRPRATATVSVRPSQPSGSATVSVRPSQPSAVQANTNVRPGTAARPATTVQANTNVRPGTAARPVTTPSASAMVGQAHARPVTTVTTTTGRSAPTGSVASVMTAPPQLNVRPSCRPAIAVTAPGGVLVLRGQNLQTVTQVQLGGQTLAIVSKRHDEIRARVPQRARDGAVHVRAGGRQYACGQVTVRGGR